MNSVWERVKFWLLWVIVSTLTLGICFAFLGQINGLHHVPNYAYTFDIEYPDFSMSITSGCLLGFMQWLLLKPYFRQPLIQWLVGSIVGTTLITQMSCLNYSLYLWGNFNNTTLSDLDVLIFSIQNGAVSGFFGGLTWGCIQGRTLAHKTGWSLTNAVAWAVAWGIGRAVPHIDIFRWWYWPLDRFPLSIKLAIEMGVLGTIAGSVSSVITGVVIVQFLRRDRYSL